MRISRLNSLLACIGAAFVVCTTPAKATTVQYFDQTLWSNATTGDTTITFDGVVPDNGFGGYSNSTGYMVSNVDFLGYDSLGAFSLAIVGPSLSPGIYNFSSGASLLGPAYTTLFSPDHTSTLSSRRTLRPLQPTSLPLTRVVSHSRLRFPTEARTMSQRRGLKPLDSLASPRPRQSVMRTLLLLAAQAVTLPTMPSWTTFNLERRPTQHQKRRPWF
jgi:hypothetical protein